MLLAKDPLVAVINYYLGIILCSSAIDSTGLTPDVFPLVGKERRIIGVVAVVELSIIDFSIKVELLDHEGEILIVFIRLEEELVI